MQQDFGLTKAEAEARLAAEADARAVAPAAERAAGAAYGGSWFDAGSGRLTVALTADAPAAAVRAVRSAGAAVRTVEHTERELDTALARVDRLAAPQGVSSWHVDPAASTVVVNVVESRRTDDDVQRFVTRAREAGPVSVRTVPAAPSTFAAGTVGGDPYYTGNVRCSIGFSVHGGFVTAGHCGGGGAAVRGWDGSHIGTFQGSSFPGNDYAWVSVGSGWWTVPVVLGWGHRSRPAGPRLGRGARRHLRLPVRLHHALALRHRAGPERDRQLQPGPGAPDDEDQRLRRAG
ncbi:hypothetical protein GCM10020295_74640 [Streptomyces cinereospinus]